MSDDESMAETMNTPEYLSDECEDKKHNDCEEEGSCECECHDEDDIA